MAWAGTQCHKESFSQDFVINQCTLTLLPPQFRHDLRYHDSFHHAFSLRWVLGLRKLASLCSIACPCRGDKVTIGDKIKKIFSVRFCIIIIIIFLKFSNENIFREVLQSSAVSAARRLRASGDYILSKVIWLPCYWLIIFQHVIFNSSLIYTFMNTVIYFSSTLLNTPFDIRLIRAFLMLIMMAFIRTTGG